MPKKYKRIKIGKITLRTFKRQVDADSDSSSSDTGE
jgi:hypothetical protein